MERTLNLGILAHVDAGKTTLTERILFHAGVIREIGSVDQGTTQTDTLELERQRGITIQSAIVSFRIGDLKVNLIDTPGHPDFIAEVERALGVLDGVILVVSAVEGVQSQTRRLAQALATAEIPFLIFANKIDRRGARDHDLLDEIGRKLHLRVAPINVVADIGSPESTVAMRSSEDRRDHEALINLLTETSDDLVNAYLRNDGRVNASVLEAELVRQVHERIVTPVVFGSAVTGAGVDHVASAIERFLPAARGRADDPLSGVVFKIQRASSGEKLVLARIFSGSVENRQNVTFLHPSLNGEPLEYDCRITGIERFDQGRQEVVANARAGDIVRLHGLKETRIGDILGQPPAGRPRATFTPPVLESVVNAELRPQLNAALAELADQDPLINVRRDNQRGTISVYLYGDVQKEVIVSTLADDYGVEAEFQRSTLVCVEIPLGSGSAVEEIGTPENPFLATVGLRVDPGSVGSGITYSRSLGLLPLSFYTAIEETVHATLEEGLRGWRVIDCHVSLTDVAMCPISAAGDFRNLTPLVLMEALRQAGTSVMEPVERFVLEVPATSLGAVLAAVGTSRGVAEEHEMRGTQWRITGRMPTDTVYAFEQRLPDISRGEGDLSTRFDSWAPIPGDAPSRPRPDFNPLNRKLYLAQVRQS